MHGHERDTPSPNTNFPLAPRIRYSRSMSIAVHQTIAHVPSTIFNISKKLCSRSAGLRVARNIRFFLLMSLGSKEMKEASAKVMSATYMYSSHFMNRIESSVAVVGAL